MPAVVADAIATMLAKSAQERPVTAADAGRLLQEAQWALGLEPTTMAILGERPASVSSIHRRPAAAAPAVTPAPQPHPSGPLPPQPAAPVARRRWLAPVLVAAVLLVGGGIAATVLAGGGADPAADATLEPSAAPSAEAATPAATAGPTAAPVPSATASAGEPTGAALALAAATLTAEDLPGEGWGPDPAFEAAWESNPGYRLCQPAFGDAVATDSSLGAFRQDGSGPAQVGARVQAFTPGQAEAFTAAARADVTALGGSGPGACAFEDVVLTDLQLDADEAFLIRYGANRPSAGGVVTTSLAFIRIGALVAEVIAIVPPGQSSDDILTEAVLTTSASRLAAVPQ